MSARRAIALACSAAAIGAGIAAVALAGNGAARRPQPLTVVSAPAPASAGRPLPGSALVAFDLVLRIRQGALDAYLRGLFQRGSPTYGHYLGAGAFGRRFGLGAAAAALLERRLRSLGVTVVTSYPQMTSLRVRASAATLRRTLGVVMRADRAAGGVAYHAPDRPPVLPPALRPWVLAVSGLSTRPAARSDFLPAAAEGALRPQDAQSAYDISPFYNSGIAGQGQTIAVMSLDGFSLTGYQRFSKLFGFPLTPPKIVKLQKLQESGTGETDLDTEIIHSTAPLAHIVDYQIDFNDLPDAINQIVARHSATIISGSFGGCDTTNADPAQLALDPGLRRSTETALAAAAAEGITFIFSTGDAGAYECARFDPNDHNVTVEFPADAPYALAIGGTVLSVNDDGSFGGETAWSDPASIGGGGGGINPYDAAPRWESVANVPGVSNGHRQLPDVSAAAGGDSAWHVNDGVPPGLGWISAYGTSAAAPLWAASLLLVGQYMHQQGAGPLCFAPPLLYAIAQSSSPSPPFHDVTSGNNLYYRAVPGWDFATGWGSPDLAVLAQAIVAYRRQNPLPAGGCGAATAAAASAPSGGSSPLAAVKTYWQDIAAGNYAAAYDLIAPGALDLSRAQFVASERQAGIESIRFAGSQRSKSGSSATVGVSTLITRSRRNGCQSWSGSYAMTDSSGWRIARADIAPKRC